MKQDTIKLANLLSLETIEQGLYRGLSWDLGFRALFGGQVMGQALAAAQQTMPEARNCHSFHSYFLLPGDANLPVVYDVENVRDGRSFSTRRIKAIQNGKNIFYMTASFQHPEEGLSHQAAEMPQVPAPEGVEPDIKFYEDCYDQISERMREALSYHRPLDIRTVQPIDIANPQKCAPVRQIWMRAQEALTDSIGLQQAMLAYASDYHFLATSLQPHGISVRNRQLRMATIDHAMWFHRPFHFNEWLLYSAESPFSGGARGLVRGQFFNQKGELVASTMQEGLMRKVGD
ncbi:thioesterase family protein [Aestuariibacter halophilus]|uniref:Thioesterase family protein n=1 Tax=Fluctibacter halophilus TaxID=226011 RepID=A0ABS8G4Z6_9ALTE|nr:acyl-CoA thioesterase domain-containing protein [Aestuariibacter halophilus]MCC2615657.1 thioesterase family protein [Aestuariibacter halophilus]